MPTVAFFDSCLFKLELAVCVIGQHPGQEIGVVCIGNLPW